MNFGELLVYLRESRNLTQKNIAESIGISTRNYQRYEKNQQQPVLENLLSLAKFFNVSMDYLCGRTDNPDLNNTKPIKKNSVYVSDEDQELVMTCLALPTDDKYVVLATAKAILAKESTSSLTKKPVGL